MKAKRLWTIAIALCMVLCMMPVETFATEEVASECICSASCSEGDVNEDCEVCSKDYKQCVKARQRTVASTAEEKTSVTTTEKKEEVTTKATTERQEVTTKATTERQEVTTKATTEKQEVTTKATTEKQEVTTKTTTERQEVTTKATTEKEEVTTEKEEDIIAQDDEGDSGDTKGTDIEINETNFPDEAFRSWIVNNISGADDNVLTSVEIEAVKSIDVSDQGIESLVGIKQFKNLETLNCSNNKLKTLDLAGLESLKTVDADGQDGGTATVVEEEDGWKLYMKDIVGADNLENVEFKDNSFSEGTEYKAGVVIFTSEPDITALTYSYKTGSNNDMEVILQLEKKALSEPDPDFKITLYKDKFDFGEKCVGIVPVAQEFNIENKLSESVKFEVVSTSQNSNYNITLEGLKNGNLEAGDVVIVKLQPKSGLKAGTYNENFSIKINGKEVETFSASFQIVDHTKKTTWSSDSDKHWHECTNCGTKFDESTHSFVWKVDQEPTSTKEGSGHNECSVCGYRGVTTAIPASIDVNETNFPDVAFRNWIIKNIPGAEDKVLTAEEIEAVKSINVSGQGIKSLVGIKQFKNLETLNCSNNNLKTLDLTGMKALKTVNAAGQKSTATVVEEKDGWKLYMKNIVGEDNIKNVEFAANSLPEGAEYKDGVVIFASEPDIASLTYSYKTGANKDMDVTLALDKEALGVVGQDFKITLYKDKFDFGKKCVGIVPAAQEFKIQNKSSESVKFEVVSTSQNSNYNITLEGLKNGNLEAGDVATVKLQPKSGLKVGTYNENFSIKINGKEVETVSASFQVIDHTKKTTWSSDSDKHWHECTNCGTKLDSVAHSFVWKVDQQATATKNGYGHYECSVCGYKKASVIIAATGTTATRTVTATTAKSLLSKIIPTTGDDSHIVLWLGVLVICGVTILGALGRYLSKRK